MRVRKLSPPGAGDAFASGDMMFGHGQADYYVNKADGVGQLVDTRLRLWTGQWYLNTQDGTPWATEVLGKYTDDIRDMAIQDRINDTPGVLDIQGYNSQLDRQTRDWTVNATIKTIYGTYVFNGPR